MLMEVIFIFKLIDTSLSMKWKPGLIPQIFKYSVIDVKDLIIYLSLLLFVAIFRMALQS